MFDHYCFSKVRFLAKIEPKKQGLLPGLLVPRSFDVRPWASDRSCLEMRLHWTHRTMIVWSCWFRWWQTNRQTDKQWNRQADKQIAYVRHTPQKGTRILETKGRQQEEPNAEIEVGGRMGAKAATTNQSQGRFGKSRTNPIFFQPLQLMLSGENMAWYSDQEEPQMKQHAHRTLRRHSQCRTLADHRQQCRSWFRTRAWPSYQFVCLPWWNRSRCETSNCISNFLHVHPVARNMIKLCFSILSQFVATN